jgi:hypothetical protein
MALIDGNNLYYSTTASTNYTFDFNDSTLAYSVAPGGINALGGSPPQVPTGLTAVPVSGNQIDLTWSHSGGLATSYTIYESTSSTSGFTSIGTTVGTTFNVSGLAANTTYYYYLTASDNYGTSSDSTTASATTPSYTANYTNMFLRGTMNGWGATEMSLVSNDLWQVTVLLQANTNYQYKYEVSGLSTWSTSWGESGNSTNSTSSGTAVQSGNNIYYSTGPGTVYTFDFDDSSLAYSVAAAGEGSLVVVGGLARPKITFSLSGANLTLSWPSTYSTWVLQERTNTMGAGTWLNVTGVTGTSVTIDMKPIKLATGTVFYRLAPPQ